MFKTSFPKKIIILKRIIENYLEASSFMSKFGILFFLDATF